MSRLLSLLSAVSLLVHAAAPIAARDDAPNIRTGFRVVASVRYLPGKPTAKPPPPAPLKGAAVQVFAEGDDKAVVEAKTDDKGLFVVALPAGQYRVEVAPPSGAVGQGLVKVEVKMGEVSETKLDFVVPLK